MTSPTFIKPMNGCKIVQWNDQTFLFGQPPEVVKGLRRHDVTTLNTLVLLDTKERQGVLLNSLEFPLYFILFMTDNVQPDQRINLVGERGDIYQAIEILRLTLLGPTEQELNLWETDHHLKQEWLNANKAFAFKDSNGEVRNIESFFNIFAFENGSVQVGEFTVRHKGIDQFSMSDGKTEIDVNIDGKEIIAPPYPIQSDYVPSGLVKFGIEVLGGASGFSPNGPCTGLALCFNSQYILIDSIPFLDKHLFARGISKNQISAVFISHLHDDHCAMFPLMQMPHKVEIITTREVFEMAMEKLSLHLGWSTSTIKEHFLFVEVTPGEITNYYGLRIEPHVTVHSIPTIGATFWTYHNGVKRRICVVGDNQSSHSIQELSQQGLIRSETEARLRQIYKDRFDILIADGGAGAIHGDPSDALESESDRVVFVHLDELPRKFNSTFSLASSGKRYTVVEGDMAIYTSLVSQFLMRWLGMGISSRWLGSLLADQTIQKYNSDDVILVQGSESRGDVYLILTGYCEVIRHDGSDFQSVANLQAGDIMGEMAILTRKHQRNASVIARTPVTLCRFSEDTFVAFMESQDLVESLLNRWRNRKLIKTLPQFCNLSSTVQEKLACCAEIVERPANDNIEIDANHWWLLIYGKVSVPGSKKENVAADEFGFVPFNSTLSNTSAPNSSLKFSLKTDSCFLKFNKQKITKLIQATPELNYAFRKRQQQISVDDVDWLKESIQIA